MGTDHQAELLSAEGRVQISAARISLSIHRAREVDYLARSRGVFRRQDERMQLDAFALSYFFLLAAARRAGLWRVFFL